MNLCRNLKQQSLHRCQLKRLLAVHIRKLFRENGRSAVLVRALRYFLKIRFPPQVLAETEGFNPDDAMDHRLEWFNEVLLAAARLAAQHIGLR